MNATDFDSTLIRRGRDAVSFSDMVTFVATVETRPLDKLLGELPGIAQLSEMKFALAMKVLRKRFRGQAPADQMQLRALADEVAKESTDLLVASRIRELFPTDRA